MRRRDPVAARFSAELAEQLGREVTDARAIGGGSICAAYRVELDDGSAAFVKTHDAAPAGFFEAEAVGLTLLGECTAGGGAPVPAILAVTPGALALEWVEPGSPGPKVAQEFGRALAMTHLGGCGSSDGTLGRSPDGSPDGSPAGGSPAGAEGSRDPCAWFGGPTPGFIGSLPLENDSAETWPEFYATRRVLPYLRAAVDRGSIGPSDAEAVEAVLADLDRLAGPAEPPALLHGDLWGGNVLWAREGRAFLIDPAAHSGHRETDLAMLELFGVPHLERILAAYEEAAPLAPGRRDRVALHQLHPVLVHAVLFGGSYGAQAGALARAALRAV